MILDKFWTYTYCQNNRVCVCNLPYQVEAQSAQYISSHKWITAQISLNLYQLHKHLSQMLSSETVMIVRNLLCHRGLSVVKIPQRPLWHKANLNFLQYLLQYPIGSWKISWLPRHQLQLYFIQSDSVCPVFQPPNSIILWHTQNLMACLNSSSLHKLLSRWVIHFFQRSSNHNHTSSSIGTFLWGGETCLADSYSEPVHAASARKSLSDRKSSIIDLPSPPQCVPAPAKIAFPCEDSRVIGYQTIQPILFSSNGTPPVLEQPLEDRQFKSWSKWFLKEGKWIQHRFHVTFFAD